uniref:Uncharacterized protein n=1 Tax=Ascaris lumbricoides TaxID=6252 RepID=A0A0M3IWX8_ASCLU
MLRDEKCLILASWMQMVKSNMCVHWVYGVILFQLR